MIVPPPPELNGDYMMTQFRDFGVMTTAYCGGNGHDHVDGYGQQHNWHKKSIFWDLPYWKDHLLRHNLDVMHIEKNFFDNIINTVLNVQGKTKDNLKSRLDLPGICSRKELHVMENGKGPIPVFRLDGLGKKEFFEWITHHVKFPDGYASNLRNCVDMGEGKFIGLKSHDCHVIMQRLLPFAFEDLLPKNVHRAIENVHSPPSLLLFSSTAAVSPSILLHRRRHSFPSTRSALLFFSSTAVGSPPLSTVHRRRSFVLHPRRLFLLHPPIQNM